MKRLLFIGFYLNLCICLVAQTTKTYTININREDFTINNYKGKDIITSSAQNLLYDDDSELPAIPYTIVNILLPENHTLKNYTFSIGQTQTTEGVTLSANPQFLFTNQIKDTLLSLQDEYPLREYPLVVKLLNEQQLECYRYASFKVPFVAYDAISRTVNWPYEINITIETEPLNTEVGNIVRQDVIIDILKDILLNPEEIYTPTPAISTMTARTNDTEIVHYLIITSENLKNSFRPLAEWKTIKGVKAKIVTVEEIYEEYASENISNQLKIKQCIYDYYNRDSYDGLKYLLLGGDETIVPAQGCYGYTEAEGEVTLIHDMPTDLFYANLIGRFDWDADGDNIIGEPGDNSIYFPTIAVGRFPVNTADQADVLVQRTINYEKNPPTNNWYNKMLLSGATLYPDWENMKVQSEEMYEQYIQPNWSYVDKYNFFDTDTDFEEGSDYDVTRENLLEQINLGYHHIHMNCHGTEFDWLLEDSRFMRDDAILLRNNNPTIIATTACFTNAFDENSPCLSEALLRAPHSGIVAYLGATREGLDSQSGFVGPSSQHNGLFYEKLIDTNILGDALKEAKTSMIEQIGNSNYRWVLYGLNLMGDPELNIYNEVPQNITGITWRIVGGSYTCVNFGSVGLSATLSSKTDNGESYSLRLSPNTNSSVEVLFDIEDSQWGNYQLCITGKNRIPLLITDLVGTYIQNKTYSGTNVITGKDIYIGEDVTNVTEEGPVIIESGSTTFDATNSVTIKNGFECKTGATLEIK